MSEYIALRDTQFFEDRLRESRDLYVNRANQLVMVLKQEVVEAVGKANELAAKNRQLQKLVDAVDKIEEQRQRFKAGDVVLHPTKKGLTMTVELYVADGILQAVWFTKKNKLKRQLFEQAYLVSDSIQDECE